MEGIIIIEPIHSRVDGLPIPSSSLERTSFMLDLCESLKRSCVVFYKDKPYVIETYESLLARFHQDYDFDLAVVWSAYQKPAYDAIAKAKKYIKKQLDNQ